MDIPNIYLRRIKVLVLLVLVLMSLVVVRMVEKMILQAEDQHRFEEIKQGQRGRIYVHDKLEGENTLYPLSFDVKSYAVIVVPQHIADKEGIAEKISTLTKQDKGKIFDSINNDKLYIPPLKRGLSYDEAEVIKNENIKGVYIIPEYNRFYPEKSLASQVLGFVNAEGKGNYGFEGHYDNELKGSLGKIIGEKDTLGRMITLLQDEDTKDGTSYVLTLDRSVQFYVEKKLKEAIEVTGAQSGSVVIMDVKTGGIVAMASNPSYDPNDFRTYAKDNPNIFINPAIAFLYEPGSIFKTLVMAAAIDTGKLEPDTKGVFGNKVVVDGYEINTSTDKAYGEETMTQVLENSDNVAMVWVAEQLGKDALYKYINDFGFLDSTNIDLDTEVSGTTTEFKLWRDIHRATLSFGQGIAVTPIEMVCAYTTIANNGVYVYPKVVDEILIPGGEEKSVSKKEGKRIVSETTVDKINMMLQSVVDNGYDHKAKIDGYNVAGKTGTAQIPKASGGYEEEQFIHSFIGYAPIEDPRFVLLVKLDKPTSRKFASDTTAPYWKDIASYLLSFYYRIPPNQ
jgi:cell division protein FtsI/penicillin-binding protein 2